MKSTNAKKSTRKTLARHAELVEVGALGAVTGAATGAIAGPPGIVAGGVIGGVVGTIAGAVLDEEVAAADRRERVLDADIGVTGSSLGAHEIAASALTAWEKRNAVHDAKHARAELLAEHAELELLIEQLRESVEAGDNKALVEPWRQFERGLTQHLVFEERELFPAYRERAPEETRAFEQAHAAIREIIDDIGVRIELHAVRADELEDLLTALRNHRRAEELAFYRWAEDVAAVPSGKAL